MAKNTSTRRKRSSPRKKKPAGPISSLSQWFSSFQDPAKRKQNWSIFTWAIILISAAALISCISYFFTGNADQSETEIGVAQAHKVNNILGPIGAWMADLLIRKGFGLFGTKYPKIKKSLQLFEGFSLNAIVNPNEYLQVIYLDQMHFTSGFYFLRQMLMGPYPMLGVLLL